MHRLLAAVLACAFVTGASAARADAPLAVAARLPPDAAAALDRLVNDAIGRGDLPGGVLVVTSSHGVLYRRAYGIRTLEPARVANDPSTIYEFASTTKPMATASAIMLLAQRGVLRLGDRVGTWIPAFAANGKHDVTLLQLLTHTGGMQIDYVKADYQADVPAILAHTYAAGLSFAPGTKFEYSDLAFITLADVVAHAAKTPYERFVQDELFRPLGMRDAFFDTTIDAAHRARLAPQIRNESEQRLRDAYGTVPGLNGHAGMLATAGDVALLARAFLRAARGLETPGFALTPATVRAMIEPHYAGDGQVRGIGWDLDSVYSRNRGEIFARGGFGHTGSSGTSVWIDPASDVAVVFASNAHYPDTGGSTLYLEAKLDTLVAAQIRHQGGERTAIDAAREQSARYSADAARSALGFPATPGPAPTPAPSPSPSPLR
ncbi:serine hydrolase domain-containing protein [Vulcanimicrobium alpinum]|uniref:serine hydrolase domain-containing protein n=1 Tax=Vulcanimicrobium alpinum TaxID=3016050 RepID=UPI00295F035B|nr:serine hydrolase domain-containing protein [Vulcanimicrobium alpinum]